MAKILVQHDISKQIVEIEEYQLAHPILGPHYKRVRLNEKGKPYILNPDAEADSDEADVENDVETEVDVETKKGDK